MPYSHNILLLKYDSKRVKIKNFVLMQIFSCRNHLCHSSLFHSFSSEISPQTISSSNTKSSEIILQQISTLNRYHKKGSNFHSIQLKLKYEISFSLQKSIKNMSETSSEGVPWIWIMDPGTMSSKRQKLTINLVTINQYSLAEK